MSRPRRRRAALRTSADTQTKASNRQVARNLTDRHPAEVTPGLWVMIHGEYYEARDRKGRLVLAEHAPDYLVPYCSWARAVWVRPRPLPRSLRGKLRGRR